ncbi:hypothetical protein C6P40_004353 [Pichia californica]|uniref:Uncharacterized protein n=1 Tax=Pichia californica TaxID=460514 RepID=A0A9P6WMS0_9ASCO|nr:hypothetical protein C6P40_004353 [[Candida] californica]
MIEINEKGELEWINSFSFLHPKLSFVFKYSFLDSLLILIIPFLNIPNFSTTPNNSIILLCLFNLLTILLTFSFSFSLSSISLSIYRTLVPEKELAIMETYVDTEAIINQSNHFRGKKTIRYAPDSSIKINPFEQQFCIRPIYNDKIKIPVRLESTYDLNLLQINYHDFNNDNTVLNYTSRELKSFIVSDYYNSPYIKYDPSVLADNNVKIFEIPVNKPGYYTIKSATDKKDKMIRSFRSDTIIPVCPEVAFTPKINFTLEKCIDEVVDDLDITLLGVPPFTLYYEEEINGKISKSPPVYISHVENIDSPLNFKELTKNKKSKYASNYLRDITWAKSYNITIPVGEKKLQNSGNYIYSIKKIVDGFGNTISYTPDPSDKSTFYTFYSHPKPVLSLVDSNPGIPILNDTEKYLRIKISDPNLSDRESPFDVTLKYIPNENDSLHEPETFFESFDLSSTDDLKIKVDKPGTYFIDQGSSKYCNCKLGHSSLNILSAKLPKMSVSLDPIIDNCIGTTGFKFNFDFIGNSPFEIGYKISKLDANNSTKVLSIEKISSIKSDSTTLEYEFKPSSEGSYSIEFTTLSDKFYKNKIHFEQDEYRYVTYFKQKPKAYFSKTNKIQRIQCCHGASSEAKLHIEGKAPFNLTYDIISPDYETVSYSLENIYDNEINIRTPEFFKGGEHILSLKSVSDSTDCGVEFKGQEVHIDVKNDVPQLSFQKSESFDIVKGEVFTVPLRIQSTDNIDMLYLYKSFDEKTSETVTLNNYNPTKGLELSREGIYQLISFNQGNCVGKIMNDYTVEIKYIPIPSINLEDNVPGLHALKGNVFEKNKVCQTENDHITFKATGSTPFIINYDIKHPDGKIEQKVEQINNSKFVLQLITNVDGDYKYIIKNIYDSVYTEQILNKLEKTHQHSFYPITITHEVSSLPVAKFLEADSRIQTCASLLEETDKLTPINVELNGALPIFLKIDIYNEYDGTTETVEFDDLNSYHIDLTNIYDHIGIGTHVLSINQVIDANNCVFDEHSSSDNTVTIQVHDVPKIRHLIEESNQLSDFDVENDGSYYCVGDQITFMLNGIPPFNIDYEFNSVLQNVEIQGNYFKRRAPGPGELNIKSLSDSSAKECKVDYEEFNRNDLKAVIYDLPSVEIVQGDSIEEDIHEGEQVEITFLLTGTPPFKLTYIRKELEDSSKIVETEIVEDITTNEYHIMANLEGTYEAIEIQDRYCVARNHRI